MSSSPGTVEAVRGITANCWKLTRGLLAVEARERAPENPLTSYLYGMRHYGSEEMDRHLGQSTSRDFKSGGTEKCVKTHKKATFTVKVNYPVNRKMSHVCVHEVYLSEKVKNSRVSTEKMVCLGFIVRFPFVYMSVLFSEAGFWIVRTHIIVVI